MARRALLALAALALGGLALWWLYPGVFGRLAPAPPPAPAAQPTPLAAPTAAPVAAAPTTVPRPAGALLALVLDDWGYQKAPVERLKTMRFPMTTSILPNLPYSRAAADASHADGDVVILHCPMQSVKSVHRERNTLLTTMTRAQELAALNADWDSVPWLVGMNNHEGSKASADRRLMDVAAAFLKGKGAFFLDSVTTPRSAIPAAARAAGIPWARRRVFLDNVIKEPAIEAELEVAVKLALKDGSCIAIGHPHKETLNVLERMAPTLAARGVTLVTVDTLVHP
ncbi:MAG TPA: divergent polysaccharide deacetylase family protein [bacterium]|jgi:polysaccharide deacetylase 2 family uncharacterized protein YibQ|nr:divergent polysaccharide deacetylase family protein [bacterium]